MTTPPARPPERAPRGLKVPVAAVGARVGPGRAARFAAIAVVIVIAGSVASSRLFPVAPAPVATDAPAASAAAVATASEPSGSPGQGPQVGVRASLTPRIATEAVDVSALVAGTVDGSHTGWLVLIAGRLHASPLPCRSPAPLPGCMQLAIDGLQGLAVVADPALTVWPGDPPPGSVLVLVEGDRKLLYLGSVVVDPAGIASVAGLRARLAGTVPEPVGTLPTIYEADGWLVTRPLHPCGTSASGCPPQTFFLAAEQPTADGRLRPGGVGLDVMLSAAVTPDPSAGGPVLLRRRAASDCPLAMLAPCFPNPDTWELVAREDPARTVQVLLPAS